MSENEKKYDVGIQMGTAVFLIILFLIVVLAIFVQSIWVITYCNSVLQKICRSDISGDKTENCGISRDKLITTITFSIILVSMTFTTLVVVLGMFTTGIQGTIAVIETISNPYLFVIFFGIIIALESSIINDLSSVSKSGNKMCPVDNTLDLVSKIILYAAIGMLIIGSIVIWSNHKDLVKLNKSAVTIKDAINRKLEASVEAKEAKEKAEEAEEAKEAPAKEAPAKEAPAKEAPAAPAKEAAKEAAPAAPAAPAAKAEGSKEGVPAKEAAPAGAEAKAAETRAENAKTAVTNASAMVTNAVAVDCNKYSLDQLKDQVDAAEAKHNQNPQNTFYKTTYDHLKDKFDLKKDSKECEILSQGQCEPTRNLKCVKKGEAKNYNIANIFEESGLLDDYDENNPDSLKMFGFESKRQKNKAVSNKIRKLRKEGYPQRQAVAIALSLVNKGKLGPRGGLVKTTKKTTTKKTSDKTKKTSGKTKKPTKKKPTKKKPTKKKPTKK